MCKPTCRSVLQAVREPDILVVGRCAAERACLRLRRRCRHPGGGAMGSRRSLVTAAVVGLFAVTGCASNVPGKKLVVFTGSVVAPGGKPVAAAVVEVNGSIIQTDDKGTFGLLVPPAGRYVVNIRKPGFGLLSSIATRPIQGRTWTMTPGMVQSVNAALPVFVHDTTPCQQGPLSSRVNWAQFPIEHQPRAIGPGGRMTVGTYSTDLKTTVDAI